MRKKKLQKVLSLVTAMALTFTSTAWAQTGKVSGASGATTDNEKVFKVVMDETGYITPTEESQELMEANSTSDLVKKPFSWDNATVYFVLTDRFLDSDESNNHSYGRGLQEDGKTPVEGLDYKNNPGTFHGGDLNGLTQKVTEGYFNDLGVNAIWITAPYEQIHGYTSGNKKGDNANQYPDPEKGGFPYYSYHGYWALDYTNIDANMGTADDFEKFVDSCHERGIRVVMDIVMNHVGYTTMYDAQEYGFSDALKSSDAGVSWKSYYFGNSTFLTGGKPESQNFWVTDSNTWANWWGPGFVRADYPGYTSAGGDDYHMSLSGLPDVVTEKSASEVPTPPLLVNKWKGEGRYDKEQKELDDFFAKTGYKKQPRYYIIKWLTDYVREYGVDGFRCDTAKHVDLDAWNDLKIESDKALKEWRQNNPTKPGAEWTDDFWMTGEAWGHGMGKSAYFSNGFDSMINFQFNKSGNPAGMEDTYSSYAKTINSDPDFNVLSYLTSHDDSDSTSGVWSSTNEGMKKQGTCLLLAPGAVQIYYGNEVNRGLGWEDWFSNDYKDQRFRTDMDWNKIATDAGTKDVLAHWQKVGQFRNDHIAVGAGQHEQLSASPYTFKRTYHLEEEDEDKVVVSVPGAAGTYEVSVGDVFDDGETVTDAYSGEKYEVSGGVVSATCDANGVILLEGSGIVKPSVSAKAEGNATTYSSDELKITLKANKVTDTCYSINGGKAIKYNANDVIKIGADTAYEETTTLVLTGKSEEDGTVITKKYTYQRSKEPSISDGVFTVKVKKTDFSDEIPKMYVYDNEENKTELAGAWPGVELKEDPDDSNYYYYSDESITESALVILSLGATSNSGGTWRSTPDKVKGLEVKGAMLYDKDSNSFSELPSGDPGKVTINYVDESGKVLKSIYRVGVVNKKYTTHPATIDGYKLKTTPANASGTLEANTTVTYVYAKEDESGTSESESTDRPTESQRPTESTDRPTESQSPTESTDRPTESTDRPTESQSPTESTDRPTESTDRPTESQRPTESTDRPTESQRPTESTDRPTESTDRPTESQSPTESTDTPTDRPTETEEPTEEPTSAPEESKLEITGLSVSAPSGAACVKQSIKFVVKTKGGVGTVQYRFLVKKSHTTMIKNYSKSKSAIWKPSQSGTYEIKVYAKDSTGKLVKKSITKYVIKKKASVKSFKASIKSGKAKVGDSVKVTVKAADGTGRFRYKFAYKRSGNGKLYTINKYSSKKTVSWTPSKSGTYTIYAYVLDKGNGLVAKKTMKYKVVK